MLNAVVWWVFRTPGGEAKTTKLDLAGAAESAPKCGEVPNKQITRNPETDANGVAAIPAPAALDGYHKAVYGP